MLDETLITFQEVPKHLPGHVSQATLHRWRLRGLQGIKLETILVGGRRYTSLEALKRFVSATTAAADRGEQPGKQSGESRSSAVRRRAIDRAERELKKAGI